MRAIALASAAVSVAVMTAATSATTSRMRSPRSSSGMPPLARALTAATARGSVPRHVARPFHPREAAADAVPPLPDHAVHRPYANLPTCASDLSAPLGL